MSKSLYERSLEALIEKLEARVLELENENGCLRHSLSRAVENTDPGRFDLPGPDAEAFANVRESLRRMTPEQQRAALVSAGIYNHDGSLTDAYRDASDEQQARESLPFATEPHVSVPPPAPTKRLNDDEKRAALVATGWTEHTDIAQQNISVCWERGAQWYSLTDAYGLLLKDREVYKLQAAGWMMEVGIDDRERWRDTNVVLLDGEEPEWLPREWAVDRLRAKQVSAIEDTLEAAQ